MVFFLDENKKQHVACLNIALYDFERDYLSHTDPSEVLKNELPENVCNFTGNGLILDKSSISCEPSSSNDQFNCLLSIHMTYDSNYTYLSWSSITIDAETDTGSPFQNNLDKILSADLNDGIELMPYYSATHIDDNPYMRAA